MSGAGDSRRFGSQNDADGRASTSSSPPLFDGQTFYPAMTPARRPIARSADEESHHRPRASALTSIIPADRLFLGIPALPSLVAFRAVDNVPQAAQFYFNGDDATPALVRHQRFSADRALTPSEYLDAYHRPLQPAWEALGPLVVTTGRDLVPAGHAGKLENQYTWRWDRTRAPRDLPRPYPALRRDTPLAAVSVTVVGSRAVKLRVQSECATGGIEPLIHGCYYDPMTNDWRYLMPLRGPAGGRFTWLLQAFQRRDRLVVVVRSEDEPGEPFEGHVHAAAYDFELRSWTDWNGSPEVAMIAKAVADLHQIDTFLFCRQPPRRLQLVGDFQGTLFAVTHSQGEVVAWHLMEENEGTYVRAYWVRLVIPPLLETHRYSNPMVWPLLYFGGVAVVCYNRGELVWWLLRKSGVCHRGAFALPSADAQHNAHNRYTVVYTHI